MRTLSFIVVAMVAAVAIPFGATVAPFVVVTQWLRECKNVLVCTPR